MIVYPKKFTDAEWKKAEKAIKVSATGVGKTLRDLEKIAGTLDQGCAALAAGKTQPAKVLAVRKQVEAAAKTALKAVEDTLQKQKKDTPAQKYLFGMKLSVENYGRALTNRLDPSDHRGFDWAVESFNGYVSSIK